MSGSHIVVVLTNTKGDVEEHRVCDKHIISDRGEPFNTRATAHHRHCPVGPTPKYGRVALRWPPIYHPVVVRSISVTVVLLRRPAVPRISDNIGRMSLRCTSPRWWATSQLRRLWLWRMTLCIFKVHRKGENLHAQTVYVHAIMTPYDSCKRVLWRLLI